MKYNTLLVPVVAFATLASALPTDGSVSAAGYPSDQGSYKARMKTEKNKNTSPPPSTPLEKVAGLPPQAKLPVQAGAVPVPTSIVSGPTGALPISMVSSAPFNVVEAAEGRLPVRPDAGEMKEKVLKEAPVHDVPPSAPTPGFLPKLPTDLPMQVVQKVTGGRRHVTRDRKNKQTCGHLLVVASDNAFSGFVSADRDENGRYTVVKDASEGVLVDLDGHDLVFRNMGMYPALGATFGAMHDRNASEDNMQGNSANFAMLTGTGQTAFGKRDTDAASSFNDATGASQKVESAIYSFGENNEVHGTWTNTNGQGVPMQFGVNPEKEIIMSANVGQYAATYGGKSARVFCSGH